MAEPAQRKPFLWRWQYAIVLIAPLAAVALLGILSRTDGDSSAHKGPTPNSAAPAVATESDAPRPSSLSPDAASSPSTARARGITLGRDLLPIEYETCHTPTFGNGSGWQVGPVQVTGRNYDSAYFCNLFSGGVGSLDFVLGKSYRELSVTVGFADDSSSLQHSVKFEIIGDDKLYLAPPRTLRFGETADLMVDLSDVARLKLKITELTRSGGTDAPSKPVWASPIITSAS